MIEQVKEMEEMAESLGFNLVEFQSPVSIGIYRQPCGQASYRLVEKTTGKIKTYGTLETIRAYLLMNNRF